MPSESCYPAFEMLVTISITTWIPSLPRVLSDLGASKATLDPSTKSEFDAASRADSFYPHHPRPHPQLQPTHPTKAPTGCDTTGSLYGYDMFEVNGDGFNYFL